MRAKTQGMQRGQTDDPLTIYSVKPLRPKEGNVVRAILDDDAFAELHRLHDETGIALSQLTRIMVEYALPRVEVKR